MQYHRHVFSPYTLYLANCVELVYAQYPKFLLLKIFFKWALPARLSDCEIKISNFFFSKHPKTFAFDSFILEYICTYMYICSLKGKHF